VHHRQHLFGDLRDGLVVLSDIGKIVAQCWDELPKHFPNVHLDERVIMPDHFHAILWIGNDGIDTRTTHRPIPDPNRTVDACIDRPTTCIDNRTIHRSIPNPNRRVDACVDRPTTDIDHPTTDIDRPTTDVDHPTTCVDRPKGPAPQSLAAIVGTFKSATTRAVRQKTGIPDLAVWQRKYHDRILRSEEELNRTRIYILDNPRRPFDPHCPQTAPHT
jgi:putative transposase